MAINDLPSTSENKPSLFLSLRPKKNCANPIMEKNKFSNSDDILSRMDRFSISHASCSSYVPLNEHQNNIMPEQSLNNTQNNSGANIHKTNCNSIGFDDSDLIIMGTPSITKNTSESTGNNTKEEVDLIELLGRDWPMQAGDSLTNILNSDYNYNKDTISKQDFKKYDSNHHLKHTHNRYSVNTERKKSMNPVSHILNNKKIVDQSVKDFISKQVQPKLNHLDIHSDLPAPTSELSKGLNAQAPVHSPAGLEDYFPESSVSGICEPKNSDVKIETITKLEGSDLDIGSMVQVTTDVSEPLYGVLRWLGRNSANSRNILAGVELEDEHLHLPLTLTDGTYYGKRLFECPLNRALFVPLDQCHQDERFLDQKHEQLTHSRSYHNILSDNDTRLFGNVECPAVPGSISPLSKTSDLESVCGKFRGIQGHHNSCYLDATLFSMFTFTSVFDALLFRPRGYQDSNHYEEVQKVLREEIVNPLRKNLFVRADKVMKLRKLLEKLSSVTGLTCEEKDPEEFLNCLLSQILHADPFLKLSSGQDAFYYQLFVEKDERLLLPSVQQLFEQSFLASDIKLKQVPSCLIIQMPRFGKSFKMYPRILPSQLLDVTDIIEDSPRQCTVCGKLAQFECKDCFGQCGMGLESTAFCGHCLETVHSHAKRANHKAKRLSVPIDFSIMAEHCPVPRLYMELFAVVCIETSHYVTFVKAGSGHDVPWCFFDSMADRKGEQNGYNIPEMVSVPDLPEWLSDEGARMLHEQCPNDKQLPEHAKRLMCDAYMCMYQSPDVMMYR